MTGKNQTTTTEVAPPTRARILIPVRVRLTMMTLLLAALALAGAGFSAYLIQTERLIQSAHSEVAQELSEFAKTHDNINPATGERFHDPRTLFRFFLGRNVPDDDEVLVGWIDGAPALRTPSSDLTDDPIFLAAVRTHMASGGSEYIDSPRFGNVLVSVQPVVVGDDPPGPPNDALVVATLMDETNANLNSTMRTYVLVAIAALFIIAVLAFWQAGRLLAPLRAVRSTAAELSTSDLSKRIPVRGNDDITALTVTFNDMLERLESGMRAQRRFLDDAGHELKTPLTVLAGHLELLDPGNEREVEHTRDLLLDEVDRMSRLVGDLILLAKSRRPDFLQSEEVDLEMLTRNCLAKARGLADRKWSLESLGSGTVILDEQRITQAVLQLADNAVKHTEDGDHIALGSSFSATAVKLWVADDGEGIPPEARQRIFDRFARAEVKPGDEGFGLGLSIVSAIVQGHGGLVAVADPEPPMSGARLVITIPVGSGQEDSRGAHSDR